jgi:hypothetical protein
MPPRHPLILKIKVNSDEELKPPCGQRGPRVRSDQDATKNPGLYQCAHFRSKHFLKMTCLARAHTQVLLRHAQRLSVNSPNWLCQLDETRLSHQS